MRTSVRVLGVALALAVFYVIVVLTLNWPEDGGFSAIRD
jgi:hypothetical protein